MQLQLYSVGFSNRYDRDIQKSVKLYWVDFNYWKWWKAQLYQESRLRSDAVSPVGAKGLAQFMPNTWKQIAKEMGYRTSITPFYTYESIFAGAYYMRKLRNSWSWNRPVLEKHYLALASYNGGIGNIIKAQKLCSNALLWGDIKECLPQVTGHHSVETITYIERIKRWVSLL